MTQIRRIIADEISVNQNLVTLSVVEMSVVEMSFISVLINDLK